MPLVYRITFRLISGNNVFIDMIDVHFNNFIVSANIITCRCVVARIILLLLRIVVAVFIEVKLL